MKKAVIILFVLTLLFCSNLLAADVKGLIDDKSRLLEKEHHFDVVVIDPGHGGKDVGATSKDGTYEKKITLIVAKRLKSLIESSIKNVKVYLTRTGDDSVSLRARARYANKMNADIFLSIHANASEHLSISGCETFFYENDASDEQARLLAELENQSGGFDEDKPENALEFILMDMAKSENISLSYNFANVIQKEYVKSVKSRDRGVKQAPFTVLEGAKMPAVLTEIGFLSSKKDGSKLLDKNYLENIAKALNKSIKRYKEITGIKNGKAKK
ncbi:N-acetylmuramoyl-L-alanine amidase [Thermodesulfobacteriota bacterium]